MSIDKKMLGAAIKRVRIARGLTQTGLAKAAGLSEGGKSVALIEQGRRSVSVESLNSIAGSLNIPPACLTILGSKTPSTGAKKEFMDSLQNLVSTVIVAQAQLQAEAKGEKSKKQIIAAEQKRLSNAAGMFRRFTATKQMETA